MTIRLLDAKFRNNKLKYIAQATMAGLAVGMALLFFDVVHQPAIIASFGASAFVAFTVPGQKFSGPRYLVGGYLIGVLVGGSVHFLTDVPVDFYFAEKALYIVSGGIAVGIAMFLMAITNTEHAPATGIALGLVINDWTYRTIIMVIAGIIVISIIQRLMRFWMMDLIEVGDDEDLD